jgi:peptidoglycan/LPS O-acetylase OafA/YrhL
VDGLRALAILAVVAYHAGFSWARGGLVGVDIFFVISGYLIGSQIYFSIRADTFSVADFYRRRAKRILPALFAVLAFSYIAASVLLSPLEARDFGRSAFTASLSFSNLLFWLKDGYFADQASHLPLLMTWSLAVEEQFYLLFPLFMLSLKKKSAKFQIVALGTVTALSMVFCAWATHSYPTAAFYLLPARAWELGAGVLIAITESPSTKRQLPSITRHTLGVFALALVVISIGFLRPESRFPWWTAAIPVAAACMFLCSRGGILNRCLSAPPFVFIGLVSYSWYLWHWPMLSFARIASPAPISPRVALFLALLSFAVAVCSWRFIEQPFRRSSTPAPKLLLRYAFLLFVFGAPGIAYWVTGGLPDRYKEAARIEGPVLLERHDVCMAGFGESQPHLSSLCAPDDGKPAIALLGDSHAAALAPALRLMFRDRGYQIYELAKASCPPLKDITAFREDHPALSNDCALFNQNVLRFVATHNNVDMVLLAAHWSGYLGGELHDKTGLGPPADRLSTLSVSNSTDNLRRGLDAVIHALTASHKRIGLLQDVCVFEIDPRSEVLARLLPARHLLARLVAPSAATVPAADMAYPIITTEDAVSRRILGQIASAYPDLALTDTQKPLCSTDGCRYAIGDDLLFADSNHLTPLGAATVLSDLRLPYGGLRATK